MSTRKKSAEPPRQPKLPAAPAAPAPAPGALDLDAMLMIGEERVHIDCEEDDNITFMAEPIE